MGLRLRLLGPVEAWAGDRKIQLGARKGRLVLAILALEVNRPVELARLVDLAWPEDPPPTATHAIRVCVSSLRSAFRGVAGLEFQLRGSGYALVTDPMNVDLHNFRSLLAQARGIGGDAARVAILDRALALWSGPALDGTAAPEIQQRLCAGLEEARLGAIEDRLDAQLRLGRHHQVIEELSSLASMYPLRERLTSQLMLALYRDGRSADALSVFRGCRDHLAEELGLDPGSVLQQLELAILREDPSLDLPQRVHASHPAEGSRSAGSPSPRSTHLGLGAAPAQRASKASIVGRAAELARLDAVVAAAAQRRSQNLVIRGEPGIGKSMLLEYLASSGEDLRVLRACGAEFESELAFSGLHELVRPLVWLIDSLPPAQAEALQIALAMSRDGSVNRLNVFLATLNLLALAAEQQPVMCLVDDAHWLDRASAEALLFAARRTLADGVSVIFAARDMPGFAAPGLPELILGGLDHAAGVQLAVQSSGISTRAAAQLVTATAGNPLALVELPAVLSQEEQRGEAPLDQPLPIAGRVEAAFMEQVRPLPADTRQALLTCVLCDGGDVGVLSRALTAAGLALDALDPAVAAGLVSVRGGVASSRHPLISSAVYAAAGPGQRRIAHLHLAAALDNADNADRRAWHLASAADGPDEHAAEALVGTADRAKRRGGVIAEARALERAADLSADHQHEAERLYRAAKAWVDAGATERAAAMYDQVLVVSRDPTVRALAQGGRAYLAFSRGEGAAARDTFIAEAEKYATSDSLAAGRLMSIVINYDAAQLNASGMLRIAKRAFDLAFPPGASMSDFPPVAVRLAYAQVLCGLADGRELAQACVPLAKQGRPNGTAVELAEVLTWLEQYETARWLLQEGTRQARQDNDVLLLAFTLPRLAHVEVLAGRLRAAQAAAVEAVEIAEQIGQPWQRAHRLADLGMVEAVLGAEADCRAHADQARLIDSAQFPDREVKIRYERGVAALGAGHPADAVEELEWAEERLRRGGIIEPAVVPVAANLAEAYLRLGQSDLAATVTERLETASEHTGRRWCQATAARCRMLLASDSDVDLVFKRALRLHDSSRVPLERARTLLCYGQRLRKSGCGHEAAQWLGEALRAFEEMGSAGWAHQCRAEIGRLGRPVSTPRSSAALPPAPQPGRLTTREQQIALSVAAGLTDEEISVRVFLSPSTVRHHLDLIYRKLGLRSRQDLAQHLLGPSGL